MATLLVNETKKLTSENGYNAVALFMLLLGFVSCCHMTCAKLAISSKERSSDWWRRIAPQFYNDEWEDNFRLNRETFKYLYNKVGKKLRKNLS